MSVIRPKVSWSVASDVGRRRRNNEDAWGAFLVLDGKTRPLDAPLSEVADQEVLFILSDGMGGALAGEEASRFCVGDVSARLAVHGSWRKPAGTMRKAMSETHAALTKRGHERPEWRGMGATLSIVWLLPDQRMVIGHVGDSRIYRSRAGKFAQLTEDHSVGAGMIRRGETTRGGTPDFRFWSMLEQAMGGDGGRISPQVVEYRWEIGDAFALCSDGLYGPLEDQIEPALNEAMTDASSKSARKLIDAANLAGGPDNITV